MLKFIVSLLIMVNCAAMAAEEPDTLLQDIRLPAGFTITIFAADVPGARSLALGRKGTVFVGTRKEGKVYALVSRDGTRADAVITLASGLNAPNGVAFLNGSLYVAEIERILRFDAVEDNLGSGLHPRIVYKGLPADPRHGWRYIAFGPDRKLYISVGAPCNACEPTDERYATIMRMNADGTGIEIFAKGVRDSVGFDWSPDTGILWFTDNGRDWLGENTPPDELNRAPRRGMDFGFPYRYGKNVADPRFREKPIARNFSPSEIDLGPHVAALGMRFYTGSLFPAHYKNQIFLAEHGSWNRLSPIGYRVTLVRIAKGRAHSYEVFADGWLRGIHAWGRPVDVLVMPDGALLVSDDKKGAVYRISYKQP